jgi:hypothetical protein
MRVAGEGRLGGSCDPPRRSPRIYGLDMVIPDHRFDDRCALVVDVNGARAGMTAQSLLYGDNRVQEEVLCALAEAGDGVITSLSQSGSLPLQDKFSAARLQCVTAGRLGWYQCHDAFVPAGDPADRSSENTTRDAARRLGIELRFAELVSRGHDLLIRTGDATEPFASWEPAGVIWPYAWDQRLLGLPPGTRVCNELEYSLPTTNKILTQLLGAAEGYMPAASLCGLWLPEGTRYEYAMRMANISPSSLVVFKPLVGRRSFGVIVVPAENVHGLLSALGFIVDVDDLERAVGLTCIALMWGQAVELLALCQEYVPPVTFRHPSGAPHAGIARVTVISDSRGVRVVDAVAILAQLPRFSPKRESLIYTSSSEPVVLGLTDDQQYAVQTTAKHFISKLERSVEKQLASARPTDILRKEALLMIDGMEEFTDGKFFEQWVDYQDGMFGYEALSPEWEQ